MQAHAYLTHEKSTKFNEIFTYINLSVGVFAKYPPVFAVHMGGTTRALASAPVIFWLITCVCKYAIKTSLDHSHFYSGLMNGSITRLVDNVRPSFKYYSEGIDYLS